MFTYVHYVKLPQKIVDVKEKKYVDHLAPNMEVLEQYANVKLYTNTYVKNLEQ